jgi:uroporphyrinogen decarboxylase
MTRKERFKNALLLKEVDKLPHGEQMIHDELLAKILHQPLERDHDNALSKWMKETLEPENFERHKRVRELLNFDWVHLFPIEPNVETKQPENGKIVARDIWGQTLHITPQSFEIAERPINTVEQLRKYQFPPVDQFIFDDITKWANETDFWITTQIDTGLFKASQLIGFREYMEYTYDYPNEIHGFMEKFVDFQKQLVDRLLDAGADSIWFSNDHAYNDGPFISPKHLWEFDFQYTKQLVEYVHSKGYLANFHSCGYLEKSLPLIVDAGVDSLHAIQPSAGNDIIKYKQEYGKDICFIGNFDMDYLMPQGSVYEIDAHARHLIENLFENERTGYILATCNMLNNDQPVENALILHMAAEKYGR